MNAQLSEPALDQSEIDAIKDRAEREVLTGPYRLMDWMNADSRGHSLIGRLLSAPFTDSQFGEREDDVLREIHAAMRIHFRDAIEQKVSTLTKAATDQLRAY